MGMTDRDGTRQAALRLVVEGGNVTARNLGIGIRDVVGPAPRLVKAARELLGLDLAHVTRATGLAVEAAKGCEMAGAASEMALCTLQLWYEGKGVRFSEADFHREHGVRLAIGWADDRRAIRAGCALLGRPMKTLMEPSGLILDRFKAVMRPGDGIVPPMAARAMLARLENEGVRLVPAAPCGWAGVRLGKGEGVLL